MSNSLPEAIAHPTAVVMPGSELSPGVEIGPYAVIEPGVEVGANVKIGPHVHLLGRTLIGAGTVIGSGSVIGGEPQDKGYDGTRTLVRVGENCRIHEHVTIHRATTEGAGPFETVIGDRVMMMVNSHVGHNSRVDEDAILVNGSLVAGHAHVCAGAILSGNAALHQFGTIGRLTMVGGATMVTKDAPPFSIVAGSYPVLWRSPNAVGLRRAGLEREERDALRKALYSIFRDSDSIQDAAESFMQNEFATVRELAEFVLNSKRGVCAGRGSNKEL
ncbi:MAG: acyl-ACP--UDP-N-acetylglucosamine O-acyltransferase [Planctomycetes bacterium]|nr:acyl-ACP--UDP-N-acetylglucosamine O-acyltransferase [Planctomycetota bacterium]MBT4027909.1 acyl-ACP--UDP-N-acetylglucosamine O-acyltransferase [Planctomycetota bacterium]MBT4560024.1 acyl-ACP--UDP-N-acetylglucosamine O-acyltransferase [Planctomycetota bacterium]MBT5100466.1 acyl-ACP--UDP-N-acetylglucosamine O-acyltransferase [Planctomycetota bacterium]MBT7012679.1 acyl-ACP--UDP-N-acetylglucosamine O-acyltransferase [Planctomycetota bacterium]